MTDKKENLIIFDLQLFDGKPGTIVSASSASEKLSVGGSDGTSLLYTSSRSFSSIISSSDKYSIAGVNAGAGNDTIEVDASQSNVNGLSILGGRGNDSIGISNNGNNGAIFVYNSGDGNDTIAGWNKNQTFNIASGLNKTDWDSGKSKYVSMSEDGKDMIIKVGSGSIRFQGVGQAASSTSQTSISLIFGNNASASENFVVPAMKQGTTKSEVIDNVTSIIDGKNSTTNIYSLDGGAGNDTIRNAGDYIYIIGGAGNDKIYVQSDTTENALAKFISIRGGAGNDTIDVTANASSGTSLGAHVYDFTDSKFGNDVIIGYGSSDTILLNANDSIKSAKVDSKGNFVITTDNGTITIKDAEGGTRVNIYSGTSIASSSFVAAAADAIAKDGDVAIIPRQVVKTTSSDRASVTGHNRDRYRIELLSGNDTLYLNSVDAAYIDAGPGNDRIILTGGNGIIPTVDSDTSRMMSNNTVVTIYGGTGNDYIDATADSGTVSVRTGIHGQVSSETTVSAGHVYKFGKNDGKDTIVGFNENDTIWIYDGASVSADFDDTGKNYQIKVDNAVLTLKDYKGGQRIQIHSGTALTDIGSMVTGIIGSGDSVTVGNEVDGKSVYPEYIVPRIIQGTKNADSLVNTDHGFAVSVLAGNDKIYNIGASDVKIFGDAGNDTIYLLPEDSSIYGSGVSIDGGSGNDVIYAETATKIAYGYGGSSIEVVGYNDDAPGHVYIFNETYGNDTIIGFNPDDSIHFNGNYISGATVKGHDVVLTISGNSSFSTSKATVTLKDYVTSSDTYEQPIALINSSDGKDLLYIPKEIWGTTGNDKENDEKKANHVLKNDYNGFSIYGLGGNDSIVNKGDTVTADGGAGNDTIVTSGNDGFIIGGAGNDKIVLASDTAASSTATNNIVVAGAGNDAIYFEGPTEVGGNIYRFGTADGVNTIYGFNENDSLQFSSASPITKQASDTTFIKVERTSEGQLVTYDKTKIYLQNSNQSAVEGGIKFNVQIVDSDGKVQSTDSTRETERKILGTTGNDKDNKTIKNLRELYTATDSADSYYIDAKAGNDSIISDGNYVSIDGGAGNDSIIIAQYDKDSNTPTNNVIIGGKGNDVIFGNGGNGAEVNGGHVYVYTKGDGNDTIHNFDVAHDSISIAGGVKYDYASVTANGFLIKVGTGSILLKADNNADLDPESEYNVKILGDGGASEAEVQKVIFGTNANNLLHNAREGYKIDAYNGNDSIINSEGGDSVKIDAGAGNDRISLMGGDNVTVIAGAGNDEIVVYDIEKQNNHVYEFKTGDGNNSIRGLNENDTIKFTTSNLSIKSGEFVGTGANEAYVLTLTDNKTKIYLQAIQSDATTATAVSDAFSATPLRNTTFNVQYSNNSGAQTYVIPNEIAVTGTSVVYYLANYASGSTTINASDNARVYGDKTDNTIYNIEANGVVIDGGIGKDIISIVGGEENTIIGGAGNDSIYFHTGGHVFKYTKNDGNDVITGWSSSDTLVLEGITAANQVSTLMSGRDFIVKVGAGVITFKDIEVDTKINIASGIAAIDNVDYLVPRILKGTNGNDFSNTALINALPEDGSDRADRFRIEALTGNDSVYTAGKDVSVYGGAGNDSITNVGDNAVIFGEAGNDYIRNESKNSSINAGAGNDTISLSSSADGTSVEGGLGDDLIYSNLSNDGGNVYIYNGNDGNDTIVGFNSRDTLYISNTSVSGASIGADGYIISLGNSKKIVLRGALPEGASSDAVSSFAPLTKDTAINFVVNGVSSTSLVSAEKYVVKGVAFVNPEEDDGYVIKTADNSADTIYNYAVDTSIDAGKGDDVIINEAENVSINAGDGADLILMSSISSLGIPKKYASYSDTAKSLAQNVTIYGGKGNDTIVGPGNETGNVYQYANGDGNDVIYGFTSADSIEFIGNNVSIKAYEFLNTTMESNGNTVDDPNHKDVVFTIGSNKVTLKGLEVGTTINHFNRDDRTSDTFTVAKFHQLSGTEGRTSSNPFVNDLEGYEIKGTSSSNFIKNYAKDVSINGSSGSNSIVSANRNVDGSETTATNVYITAGTGNDTIVNEGSQATINAGKGKNYIINKEDANGAIITTGEDIDIITNYADGVSIDAGKGKNVITSGKWDTNSDTRISANNVSISAGDSNDSIVVYGEDLIIDAGSGNDTIYIHFDSDTASDRVLVYAGNGNDYINANNAKNVTYVYSIGGGNDTIYNFDSSGKIKIDGYNSESHIIKAFGNEKSFNIQVIDSATNKVTGTIYLNKLNGTQVSLLDGGINVQIVDGNDQHLDNFTTPRLKVGTTGKDTNLDPNTDDEYFINLFAGDDSFTNSGASVTVDGGAGKDTILNSGNDVSIFGGNDADVISLIGGENNEGGNATINGGAGNDIIRVYTKDGVNNVYEIKAGDGVDTIYGFKKDDTIHFTDNLGIKTGEFNGDFYVLTLTDNKTKIYLQGVGSQFNNSDVSTATAAFNTSYLKGTEFYTISGSSTDVGTFSILNEIAVTGTGVYYLSDTATSNGYSIGAADHAVIKGDNYDNVIENLGVEDVMIYGGKGNDSIYIHKTTSNSIIGGEGNDTLIFDSVEGNDGHVVIYNKNDGNDVIYGWKDTDSLHIEGVPNITTSVVSLDAATGKTDFVINVGTNKITFKEIKVDTVINVSGVTGGVSEIVVPRLIQGTAGSDSIDNGGLDSDRYYIDAGSGNDSILSTGDNVTVNAGVGNDTVLSTGANVSIDAGAGNDIIYHEGQNVSINAGTGADIISLGSSSDKSLIIAGEGNDTIYGQTNSTNGTNYIYKIGDGNDLILGYTERDSITIESNGRSNVSIEGSSITTSGFVITLSGGATLTFRGPRDDENTGDNLADFNPLAGGTRINLTIEGVVPTNSDTTLFVPMEKSVVKDSPFVNPEEDERYSIRGTASADTITNNAASTTIIANGGNDVIVNVASYVSINGGDGHDLILMDYVSGTGISTVYASYNNSDTFASLASGADNVTINAGQGNDTIVGIASENGHTYQYHLGDGDDVIYGFTDEDVLDLTSSRFSIDENSFTVRNVYEGNNDIPELKDVILKLGNNTITFKKLDINTSINIINNTATSAETTVSIPETFTYQVSKIHVLTGNEGKDVANTFVNVIDDYEIRSEARADYITNYGARVSIKASAGNNYIQNIIDGDSNLNPTNAYISASSNNDTIINDGEDTTIEAGGGKNAILNRSKAENTSIVTGANEDSIVNYAAGTSIYAGNGSNTIISGHSDTLAGSVYIETGSNNDSVISYGNEVTINTGAGADYIWISDDSADVVITAGEGNDSIVGNGGNVTYLYTIGKDGTDTIFNYTADSKIKFENFDSSTHYISTGIKNNAYAIEVVKKSNDKAEATIYLRALESSTAPIPLLDGDLRISVVDQNDNSLVDENLVTPKMLLGTGNNDAFTNTTVQGYVVSLLGGDDRFVNSESGVALTIDGGAGKDVIINAADQVSIYGGADNDSIYLAHVTSDALVAPSEVTIRGGKGNDYIVASSTRTANAVIYEYATGDGNDTIVGFTVGLDTINVEGDYSYSVDNDNNFIINVGSGKDAGSINLGQLDKNSDVYVRKVTILTTDEDGNPLEEEVLVYDEATIKVPSVINISTNDSSLVSYVPEMAGSSTTILAYTYYNTSDSDYTNATDNLIINGTNNSSKGDSIKNEGNNVLIYGYAGNDYIEIVGDPSGVIIDGGAGNDTIKATEDHGNGIVYKFDTVSGNNDVIIGYSDQDTIKLTSGTADKVGITVEARPNTESDTYAYNHVVLSNGNSRVTLKGFARDSGVINIDDGSKVRVYEVPKILPGTTSNETIETEDDNYLVDARAGNDTIITSNANTTVDAGAGNDSIYSEGVHNSLVGGEGNDIIYSKGNDATIDGGKGNDYITVEGKRASVNAGEGADRISIGSTAEDVTVYAGAGNDTIYNYTSNGNIYEFANGQGTNYIYGFNTDKDIIRIADASSLGAINDSSFTVVSGNRGDLKLNIGSSSNIIIKDVEQGTVIRVQDSVANDIQGEVKAPHKVNGTNGADRESVFSAASGGGSVAGDGYYILGLGGNDSIYNIGPYATIDGGAGDDRISNTGIGSSIYGGAGNDVIINSASEVSIYGGAGNDSIVNTDKHGIVYVFGGTSDGNNTITGFNPYSDTIVFNAGTKVTGATLSADQKTYSFAVGNTIVHLNKFNDSAWTWNNNTLTDGYIKIGSTDSTNTLEKPTVWYGDDSASKFNNGNGEASLIYVGGGSDTVINANAGTRIIATINGATSVQANNINLFSNTAITSSSGVSAVTIIGGQGSDTVINSADSWRTNIQTGAGNDSIVNKGRAVTINAGAGNDYILNEVSGNDSTTKITITADTGDDSIDNKAAWAIINGGAGADVITNYITTGVHVTINGDAGADIIYNSATTVYINGGNDGDFIYNASEASEVSIYGGAGNDYIFNAANAFGTSVTVTVTVGGASQTSVVPAVLNPVYISGDAGNDVIYNTGNWVSIVAGAGNDSINSTGNNVTYIFGGNQGNNTIVNWEIGSDTIRFNGGKPNGKLNSTISPDNKTVSFAISGTTFNITKKDGTFDRSGDTGIKFLFNNNVATTIHLASPSVLTGNAEADNFSVTAGEGVKIIYTGDGNDVVTNHAADVKIYATLAGNASTGNNNNSITNDANTSSTGITAVQIYGGADSDTITNGSDSWRTLINAGAGNDSIVNAGKLVTIDAGAGNDFVINTGDKEETTGVRITLGAGDDVASNTGAYAYIVAGNGDDSILNSGHRVTINAGAGADSITNSGSDVVITLASSANDSAHANYLSNSGDSVSIYGGSNYDSIINTGNNVILTADAGNDTLGNTGSGVRISLNSGANYLTNSGANTSIFGGSGADTVINTATSVYILGAAGNDSIISYNIVTIDAGAGADYISIASEVAIGSSIFAGAGNDSIINYAKEATIYGGDGADYISIETETAINISINAGAGNDSVYSRGRGTVIELVGGTNYVYNYEAASSTSIYGGTGADNIYNTATKVSISLVAGADRVYNYGDGAIIDVGITSGTASSDNDRVENYGSGTSIVTGLGADTIYSYGTSSETTIVSGGGNDSIISYGVKVTIDAGAGADYIYSYGKEATIDAGADNDYIYSYGNKASIDAGVGNNVIVIGLNAQSNTVIAGAGNDRISLESNAMYNSITAGAGNDIIYSNGQGNTFIFTASSGNDTIVNFNAEKDKIVIEGDLSGSVTPSLVGGNQLLLIGNSAGATINLGKTIYNGDSISVHYSSGDYSVSITGGLDRPTANPRIAPEEVPVLIDDLFSDDNFMTNDAQISDITNITADNYSAGNIEILDPEKLTQGGYVPTATYGTEKKQE